jgi:hypothetical protein
VQHPSSITLYFCGGSSDSLFSFFAGHVHYTQLEGNGTFYMRANSLQTMQKYLQAAQIDSSTFSGSYLDPSTTCFTIEEDTTDDVMVKDRVKH